LTAARRRRFRFGGRWCLRSLCGKRVLRADALLPDQRVPDFSRTNARRPATLITLEKSTIRPSVAISSFFFIEMPFRRPDD
jgi:hypothetical protein